LSAEGNFDQTSVVDTVDVEQMRPLLEAKLQPWRLRATLTFAGLFQLTHDMIRQVVLQNVKDFYLRGFDESGLVYDKDRYMADVLDRDQKSPLRASLLWLVDMNAITMQQAERLHEITKHRNDLMHELAKYLVDPKFEPDMALFVDALDILRAIHNFWIQIEIDTGWVDEHRGITPADVAPLSLMLLSMCIDAYADGLGSEHETARSPET
jgi:hypothetical protein